MKVCKGERSLGHPLPSLAEDVSICAAISPLAAKAPITKHFPAINSLVGTPGIRAVPESFQERSSSLLPSHRWARLLRRTNSIDLRIETWRSIGASNRRAWFLYEFLSGRSLDIPDAAEASFTDLLDGRLYFTAAPRLSRRHKVRDNLLGTPAFCPVIRKTQALVDFGTRALGTNANEVIGRTGASVVARAANFSCSRTVAQASRSRVKSRREADWSGGDAQCCRPERTN